MIRELTNRIRGRKKLKDKLFSLEEVLDFLNHLTPSIRVDLFYNGKIDLFYSGKINKFSWLKRKPASISAFLRFQFGRDNDELSSNKYQLYVGRKSCKGYIDLKDSHQKVSLSYLI